MIAHIISYGQWWNEGPRELTIAIFMWAFGFVVGILLAHRHIVKPAEKRHEEVMDSHKKIHKSLEIK